MPILLSSRHWNTPSSCDVTSLTTSEDPEILKRCDGAMGSALNSQVMFGEGFPLAMQVKRAEEPDGTIWLDRPSVTNTGSVEEKRNINVIMSSAANGPRSLPKKRSHLVHLTENIHSIVSAGHGSLLGLSSAGVAPFVAPRHRSEGQVVVLSLVRRSRCDLLTVLKPFGCWCRTTGHDALQHQRLRQLHGDGQRGGGVNYPD